MADVKAEHDDGNENGYSGESGGRSNNQSDNERNRSRSPVRRSRSRSPRDKRGDRRDRDRDRDRHRGPVTTTRIYVSNIPYETRWQDLKDLFKKEVGDVEFVELYDTPDGKPCGAGVIEFKDKAAAGRALDKMHRFEIKDRKIVVREERDSDRRRHDSQRRGGRGGGGGGGGGGGSQGGDFGMDSMGMGGGMGGMGMGGNSGMGMGGGGLAGAGPMNMMGNNSNMGGGSTAGVTPQLLQQLGVEGPVTNQLFVANLDYKVTDRKLLEIFKMAGNVLHVELKTDKDQKSRGMGTVRMEHPMEALQAISMFNGQILYERAMSVRMDKMAESGQQVMPNKLPSGLKTIGMGLGSGGTPLTNLAMSSIGSGASSGGNNQSMNTQPMANNMGMGMGGNMNTGMGNTGMGSMGNMSNMGMNTNMGNTGMGNMGTGMGQMNQGMGNNMGGGMGGAMNSNMGMNMNSGMSGMVSGMGTGMNDMSAQMGNQMSNMASNMNTMGNMGGMTGNMGGMDNMGGNRDTGFMQNSLMGNAGNMGLGGTGLNSGNRSNSRSGSTTRDDNAAVYVRNLPYAYTWQNLKERFRHIGEVRYAAIKTENGKSKGTGVVRFANMDLARRAVSQMNGTRIDGRDVEVSLMRGDRI